MKKKKLLEEVILFGVTKIGASEEQAFLEMECIQDMLKLQEMENLFRNNARTKAGQLRKDSQLWNRLNDRLELLISEAKEFGISYDFEKLSIEHYNGTEPGE